MTTIAEGNEDLKLPPGIPGEVAKIVLDIARDITHMHRSETEEVFTGGCKAFYSPRTWAERREYDGTDSLLVVVHDGGDLSDMFNVYKGDYIAQAILVGGLAEHNLHYVRHDAWYSAIYPLAGAPKRWKEYCI